MKIPKFKVQNPNLGFTLIEAIVSTAIFAFLVSSIVGVYLSAIKIDRKTRVQRTVIQNARYITEFLAKEVRNGRIDYSGSNGCILSSTSLCVVNQAGERERFYLIGNDLGFIKESSITRLDSDSVDVTNLRFYIQPLGDPFTPSKTFNQQPTVTLVLELTSNDFQRADDTAKVNIQTTFSSRLYPIRQ